MPHAGIRMFSLAISAHLGLYKTGGHQQDGMHMVQSEEPVEQTSMKGRMASVAYAIAVCVCVVPIVRQYGGWNLDRDLTAWRRTMTTLRLQTPERDILRGFSRVQALNRSYTIGVVAVTD